MSNIINPGINYHLYDHIYHPEAVVQTFIQLVDFIAWITQNRNTLGKVDPLRALRVLRGRILDYSLNVLTSLPIASLHFQSIKTSEANTTKVYPASKAP